MPSCSVKWCSNHTSTCSLKSKNGVSFHRFPKDEAMCQKWVEAIRFERRDPWWTSSNASRICSLHFKESDISSTPCKVNILAKTAVPICTMVWYDDNESKVTEKPPSNEINKIVNILKTYERKKNVLKEKTVNISNKLNADEKSKPKKVVNSIITSGFFSQTNVTRELDTKLLKTEATKTQISKEFQGSANENLNRAQKNTVLTALNNECVKYYQEKYKTNILLKLNDYTKLIVDEDRIDNTDLKESNKVSKDINTGKNENSMKLILKEMDTNENKEPNQEETNKKTTDMFVKTIKNGYVELNANVSNTYIGKILKTYLPKRRHKICGKNIRETCNHKEMINKNKWSSINMEKGLNNVKCKEIKKIKVNIYPKDAFIKNKHCNNNNLTRVQKSFTKSKENKQVCTNVQKSNFKRINKLFEIPKIEQDKPRDITPNMEANNKSKVTDIELIANQSKIDNNETDDIILEFFENSKTIDNVSDIPDNGDQGLHKNSCLELNTYADININSTLYKETNKTHFILDLDKNYTELNSFVNLKLTEDNTNDTSINKRLTQFNGNGIKSNHQMPHLYSEINENNITKSNKNMIYRENFTKNAIIFPTNELHLQSSVVNNIIAETKRDQYIELKRHLSKKPKLKSLAELCSNILTDNDKNLFSTYNNIMSTEITVENQKISDRNHNTEIDKNIHIEVKDTVSVQNSINAEAIKETDNAKQINSISLEEFITNLSPQSNNSEIMDFITNLNTDLSKTLPEFDVNISDVDIESQKLQEKSEIKTLFSLKLNEELLKDDGNRKFKDINTENHDKDSLHQETNKDFEYVLPIVKDQEILNEHMDRILSRGDTDPDFDLGLLLSDTPVDEEILNVDDSNNSLDGIEGSPNWIQLPIDELPKIIDDIMNQVSPFFENLDIFDKVNTLNLDNAAIKEDESKNPINDQYSTSNSEQFKEQIIDNCCEKQCTNKSITQIDKKLINECSDYNEPNLEQSNNICSIKFNQSKRLSTEKCYDLYNEQTDKQILEYYIQTNNEKCDNFNQEQNLAQCYENRDIEDQGNKSINQIPNYGLSKSDQIEDSLNNEYFKQNEQSRKEQDDGLDIDNVSNYEDVPEVDKKESEKQFNKQTSQSSVDQLKTSLEESTPKLKTQNQPSLQSINNQNSEDFNEKTIEKVNSILSIKDHIADTKTVPELNSEQLKSLIFEQCFDPECGDNCKNQKHKSISELHEKDVQLPEKQTTPPTPYQLDIKKRKRRYDLFYKRQCIDNFKKQLHDGSLNSDIRQKKHLIEHNLSSNDNKTKYKQIPIEKLPGKYIELRSIETEAKCNSLSPKRKHQKLGFEQSDNNCDNKNDNISQHMTECPECGYTDENNLLDYHNDMDLRIIRPLSLINKDMLLSLRSKITENNNNNNQVSLKSVYAMEFAYVTAIQALEKKLKQKIAISDYRLRRVNNLSKINNKLIETNIMLMDIADENKM